MEYDAMDVRWTSELGGSFFVHSTSRMRVVATARTQQLNTTAFSALLPCAPGEHYRIAVFLLANRSAMAREIPEEAWLPLGRFVTSRIPSKQRFVSVSATSYTTNMVNISEVKIADLVMECTPGEATLCASPHEAHLVGSWVNRGSAPGSNAALMLDSMPTVASLPPSAWKAHTLESFAGKLAGVSQSGKVHAIRPSASLRCNCRWSPFSPRGARGPAWLDYLTVPVAQATALLAGGSTPPARRPWLHIIGDSITSALGAAALTLFFNSSVILQAMHSLPTRAVRRAKERQSEVQERVEVHTERARVSFSEWMSKSVDGMFDRDPTLVFAEMGLIYRKACSSSPPPGPCAHDYPDVLIIGTGLWDIQDRPPSFMGRQLPVLRRLLDALLPMTRVVWFGPVGYYHGKPAIGRTWRTMDRLLRHTDGVLGALRDRAGDDEDKNSHAEASASSARPRWTLVDPVPFFAPVAMIRTKKTIERNGGFRRDSRHFFIPVMVEMLNVIFNMMAIVDSED